MNLLNWGFRGSAIWGWASFGVYRKLLIRTNDFKQKRKPKKGEAQNVSFLLRK